MKWSNKGHQFDELGNHFARKKYSFMERDKRVSYAVII